VQLGEGVFINRVINDDSANRGIDCLKLFRGYIDKHPISETRVIGTQTLRYAENADVFLQKAAELGFDIEVVSGEKEAFLIYKGVNRIIDNIALPRLVLDIGGGSTELSVGADISPSALTSIPMGCISWRDTFFADGTITHAAINDAIAEAKRALVTGSQTILQEQWQKVFASSGSAKVLATVLQESKVTDGTITLDGLAYIREKSLTAKSISQLKLAGLKPQRQDLIIPGMCIMQALMEFFSLTEVHYSNAALREGLLETSAMAYIANRQNSNV